jgi:tRNA(fMet)-specific endonuclease VapC
VKARFLLDADVLSEAISDPSGSVALRVSTAGHELVATSIVVAAEIRFGVARRKSARLAAQVETVLGAIDILPLEAPADRHYAEIRAELERKGTPIGWNDMLIAAHALSLGAVLVTGNVREFRRVRGLKIEDWIRSA